MKSAHNTSLIAIDLVRFISSISIVFYHVVGYIAISSIFYKNHISEFIKFVDLFFVMSGYIISFFYSKKLNNIKEILNFFSKRIARIVPLHWATLVFFILILVYSNIFGLYLNDPSRYDYRCIIPNILMINSFSTCDHDSFNFVSWSISAEIGCYIIFPVMDFLIRKNKLIFIFSTIAWVILLFCYFPMWMHYTYNFGFIRAVPSFFIGMIIFNIRNNFENVSFSEKHVLLILSLLFVSIIYNFSEVSIYLLIVSCVFIFSLMDINKISPPFRILSKMGSLTYSMYMIHPILMFIMLTTFGKLLLDLDMHGMIIMGGILILVTIPVSYLSLRYFENPLREFISNKISF